MALHYSIKDLAMRNAKSTSGTGRQVRCPSVQKPLRPSETAEYGLDQTK